MVSTEVLLGNIKLKNPIITASGTFGYGHEFSYLYDLNKLGGISIKGTTKNPRFGNPLPRIAECKEGMLNAVGLQNPGIDKVANIEIPQLRSDFDGVIIANIGGFSIEEYVYCCEKIDELKEADIIELNISCPNIHDDGKNFGTNVLDTLKVVREVRKAVNKPLFVKLTPNVTDIAEIAKACEDEGADGLSLINTLLGMRIDPKTRKPILANKIGGFSGRAIFPVALRAVYQVYEKVSIPIIGIGGISNADEVIEMMLAGATAIQVGSENLINPYASKEIANNLPSAMKKYGIKNLKEIIGGAH